MLYKLLKYSARISLSLIFGCVSLFPQFSYALPFPSTIQPQIAKAASGDVILLWDGATSSLPAEWTCISCATDDPFYNVFIVASSSYGNATLGGPETVAPTLTFDNASLASQTVANDHNDGSPNDYPDQNHTHTWDSVSAGTEDIRPPFKNLIFIKATNPTSLPNGTIAMFDVASSSLQSGWSYYASMNSNYLHANNSTTTGGASEHAHSVSGTSGAANNNIDDNGSGFTVAAASHTHGVNATLSNASNSPLFYTLVFAKLSATTSINTATTTGLIGIFDASVPSGWETFSSSGSPALGRFIKGSDNFGGIGGTSSSTHTHNDGAVTITSDVPSASLNVDDRGAGTSFQGTSASHTHNIAYTISSENSVPIYREVILGKKLEPPVTAPDLVQLHYRWRNNDGSETSATFATGTDDMLTGLYRRWYPTHRLRISLENQGDEDTTSTQFILQYSQIDGTCSAVAESAWETLINTANQQYQHWSFIHVANVLHKSSTTDVSINGGIDNNGATFTEGQILSNENLSDTIIIPAGSMTELEFSIWAENPAHVNETYCFRVVDVGSGLGITYTQYAQAKMAAQYKSRGGGPGGTTAGSGNSPPLVSNRGGGQGQGGGSGSGAGVVAGSNSTGGTSEGGGTTTGGAP